MKTCCDCNQTLPFTSFVAKTSCKDGYEPRCRHCRSIKYNKSTPELVTKKIYQTQVLNCTNRGQALPTYSKEELFTWLTAQTNFVPLMDAWKASNYSKNLAPSVDRIDPNSSYSIPNIQLMTWEENRAKGAKDKADNLHLVDQKPVAAYNKDGSLYKEYKSVQSALADVGAAQSSYHGIASVCNGVPIKDGRGAMFTPRSFKGYIWKWM